MSNVVGADPAELAEQYGTGERLATRTSFWAPSPPGQSPHDVALAELAETHPRDVLEIGCGLGAFAERMTAELGVQVVASDRSAAMVAASTARGLRAVQADAGALPFADDSFDAVAALWMLYHVPDLSATLAEVRRVLRPGGVLVAVTNGLQHTADLRAQAGLGPAVTTFLAEDAAGHLAPHFAHVRVVPTPGRAVADHATAQAYLATFAPGAAARLESYAGTRTYTGASAVVVGR